MSKPNVTCSSGTTMSLPLANKLSEIGERLQSFHLSQAHLLETLVQAETYLAEVDQSPSDSILASLVAPMQALVMPNILRHRHKDVKILVATCISQIMRITAPNVLYCDDILMEIFELIVVTFRGLDQIHGPSFERRVKILETVAKVKLSVLMLDMQCDDMIFNLFSIFFSRAREDHSENVLRAMQTIMVEILNQSDFISEKLLSILLKNLGRKNQDCSPAAYRLAMSVMKCVATKVEPNVSFFLTSRMSAKSKFENDTHNYHEIILNIYLCAPQILQSIIPTLTQELLSELSDVRLSSVKLLGRIFALPGHGLAKEFQPLLSEFLKRFTDNSVEVRLAAVRYAKECMLSNPFRPESTAINAALRDQLLDSDEAVRKGVIGAICDLANYALKCIPTETIRQVVDFLHDQTVSVRKYTLERLVEVYRVYCSKCLDGSVCNFELDWIPGKILVCCYDKEFRSQVVDVAFSQSLFPSDLPVPERVKHWIAMFSEFEKPEIKAFEEVLNQKKRLQVQMQNLLSCREKLKEEDTPELKNKILCCAKIMSRSFNDIPKAEESFIKLFEIKDNTIWKALSSLLDSSLSFVQAQLAFDCLLKQLGERHPQYEFMKILAIRCSYFLFGKEHVKEILKEIADNKLSGTVKTVISGMNLLVIFARFFPSLFDGAAKDMLQLLNDNNDHVKEGAVHILANIGCTIQGKIIANSMSVDLLLERLCVEGTRKQAKYAVQAIVAIKKDFQHEALSALYKRLVDMLEHNEHLATVLQSLGCIAQTAMPIFETREEEIIKFICCKLLQKNSISSAISETGCNGRSKECFLKICGIKTLVRSYLPFRDAHLRKGIKTLLGVLTKLITAGEISEEVLSSKDDKSHIRLAAAKAVLQLSRLWDCHINPQLFHLTLRMAQDIFPDVRKQFLAKVHRCLKDRNLHHKYACAFVLSIAGGTEHDLLESGRYLAEFVEMCQDTQLQESSLQLDCNSCTCCPEFVLSYLIHAMAHHPDFSVSNKSICAEAFEPFYRQLHFFLSVILHQDRGENHDPQKGNKVDSTTLIMTLFQSIKQMEDAVDKSKSKNLSMICDVGLLITKDIADSQVNTGSKAISISLPGLYCRTSEGSEDTHLKLSIGSPCKNKPKDGGGLESEMPSELHEEHSKSRSEVMLNEVKSAADNVMRTVAEALVLPRRKRGRPCKDGPKNSKCLESGNASEKQWRQSQIRIKEVIPIEVKSNVENDLMIAAEGSVLPKRKRGRPSKNGPKDGKSLELDKPSEKHEEKSQSTIDVVLNEVKPAANNVMPTVAEALGFPKRKRGRPSKSSVDFFSPVCTQMLSSKDSNQLKVSRPKRGCKNCLGCKSESMVSDLSTACQMQHNDQQIQRSKFFTQKRSMRLRNLDIQSVCKVEQEREGKTSDAVPMNTMVADVNFVHNDVDKMEPCNRKQMHLCKESPGFPSGQRQGLLDRSEGLMLFQCRGGCLKGSGNICDSKEKLKLPDSTIMAIERGYDGLSGEELIPVCQVLEENNVSGQNEAKISNKRLDDNCDQLGKIIQRSLLGDQKLSTQNESLDPKSEIVCLPKKKPASGPVSPQKGLNEDENNHREAQRKLTRRKRFSGVEKSAPQRLEKEIGEELVGKTIKVWWPRDKMFYEGVVESYDLRYRKHKVIYNDGDVEFLRLGKERWELIDGNPMPMKEGRTSIRSANSTGVRSLYRTRSNTVLQSVNSNAHGVSERRSNACFSESEKSLAERTADPLEFRDASAPVCSKGHQKDICVIDLTNS